MISSPALLRLKVPAQQGPYRVTLAATDEEVRAAQRLRFDVFNLELKEGLDSAHLTGLDQDPFDSWCDHLLVIDEPTGTVIGTYRLQTGAVASLHRDYYSAQEFDFAPYESIRHQMIELGRACIHQDHRNFAALSLLWKGIAKYASERNGRYLIGCSSLTSQDEALGAATYHLLAKSHLVEPTLRTDPLPHYKCCMDQLQTNCPQPPRLLRAYLGVGARICGFPALDREFKTIDFLTLLDLCNLPIIARQHFLGAC